MTIQNFEFKAAVNNLEKKEALLLELNPVFVGVDHQVDTYFTVPLGRLKLREGTIENALIHYERSNNAGSKLSSVLLYQFQPSSILKQILLKTLTIKTVVDKQRKIYFINNVKFHFDIVKDLGTFIEVEAIDNNGTVNIDKLQKQCDYYASLFSITEENFIASSYSDMLLQASV